MRKYQNMLHKILNSPQSQWKKNRTGVKALTYPGIFFEFDMSTGQFPILTTKFIPFRVVATELEGFLKGITNKKWYKERNCHIWDEWCSPHALSKIVNDQELSQQEKLKYQKECNELGKGFYGGTWRNFTGEEKNRIDQIKNIIETIKTNPDDRRMLVSAWNPALLYDAALPPCHVLWHITHLNNTLSLGWFQRSCDFFLGVPFNIASYALLLSLICHITNKKPYRLYALFSDAHVYENHLDQCKVLLSRTPKDLPTLKIDNNVKDITQWTANQVKLKNYNHHGKITAEVAV